MTTWRQRLIAAQKRGMFTRHDRLTAMGFTHCAVGEKFKLQKLETDNREVIYDFIGPKAYDLGLEFYGSIVNQDIQSAIKIYKQIQKLRVKK